MGNRSGIAFIENEFVAIDQARVPILDLGFLRSDATYDVAHVWDGRFFRLDDHLDRFFAGMRKLHMTLPLGKPEIREIAVECVRRSGLRDSFVQVICTRGVPSRPTRDPRDVENRFYAFAVPFVWIANPEKQKVGLHMHVSSIERISPKSVDPTIKNYHWLDLVLGLYDAYENGAETAVLIDPAGNLTEGPGYNIFIVQGADASTPAQGVLEGITRRTAIELLHGLGAKISIRNVTASELLDADEVFVTSTAGGIMPVTKINSKPIGTGTPGKLTSQVKTAYWDLHRDDAYSFEVEYGSKRGSDAVVERVK